MTIESSPSIKSCSSIQCQQVTIRFGAEKPPVKPAVDAVNLTIPGGEITALIGPSGCGKTTLLRSLAGLQPVSSGSISITPPAKTSDGEIGFVFQQPALLPWATTLQNVVLPLELTGQSSHDPAGNVSEILAAVKLDAAADKYPRQLSGGMQMRASIARALASQPKILLLDEPFAALDDMLRNDLGQLILSLWEQRRFTAVLVTHNINESILLSHQIAVMRQGRIETVIANPLPWPRNIDQMRTAEFASFYGAVSDALRNGEVADD